MSTDFTEKERLFIDGLVGETGEDLGWWMNAIDHSGHGNRNDIIDWLRQQGFTFARASWLERIHHNGGKLIYAGSAPAPVKPSATTRSKASSEPVPRAGGVAGSTVARVARPPAPPSDDGIDAILHAAKAYRPLAQVLLRDILEAVPGADACAVRHVIILSHRLPFAALAPSPKDVRLYLALSAATPPAWQKAKLPLGVDDLDGLTHMLSLTDARQLTVELRKLISHSARVTAL